MATFSAVAGGSFRTPTVGVVESSNIAVWIDELIVRAPSVTNNAAKQAIRAAFREFCVRSGAWQRRIGPISLIAGQMVYEVPEQDDATVLYIDSLEYNADGIEPTSQVSFLRAAQAPIYRALHVAAVGRPMMFAGINESPGGFTVYPAAGEDQTNALAIHAILGPKTPYTDDIPQFFLTWHFDALLEGATARLLQQPSKPYTNIGLAQYYARRFNAEISKARDMSRRQFTSAETIAGFPRWT